jgi:hypothetical protein
MPGGISVPEKFWGKNSSQPGQLEPGGTNASIIRSGTAAPALECAPAAHAVANWKKHLRIDGA